MNIAVRAILLVGILTFWQIVFRSSEIEDKIDRILKKLDDKDD